MYKMIIVDDETVEREGMIHFIDWKKYDIEIAGDAKNGLEGLELIGRTVPDIVLTDVKMPLMNGIQMIEESIKTFPDCIYVVLSGYGDYEYTSQAMQLGVKYYILKPCDEDHLVHVLEKVKSELKEREHERLFETERFNQEILKLLPKAKIQFLRSAITNPFLAEKEFAFYEESCGLGARELFLMVFSGDSLESHLSSFVVENIFEELMSVKDILMKTEVQNHVVFLLQADGTKRLETVIRQVKDQFKKIFGMDLHYASSDKGGLRDLYQMYEQAIARLETSEEKVNQILKSLDMEAIKNAGNFSELLVEYHSVLCMAHISKMSIYETAECYIKLMGQIYGKDDTYQKCRQVKEEPELFETAIRISVNKAGIQLTAGEQKMEKILFLIYEYAGDDRMSIQWLAKEILYINEDYLARIFKSSMKQKMPDYLCMVRMETVKRILKFRSDYSVSDLAVSAGYHEDGRYFCKVFKKYFGKTLSEYRNEL